MEVLLADFRKRTKMGQNSVGVWRFPPSSNAPSGGTPLMVPTMPSAVAAAAARAAGVGRHPHHLRALGQQVHWGHLLATAESWSRMRPSPSNMVSSVSLLSSTVTADTEGLSPHRLGSS